MVPLVWHLGSSWDVCPSPCEVNKYYSACLEDTNTILVFAQIPRVFSWNYNDCVVNIDLGVVEGSL